MFEQSTLPSGPASKRLWATCVGVTGEALLVGFAILAPMLWPQVLPRTTLITSLLPSVPVGRQKPPENRPRATQVAVHRTSATRDLAFVAPSRVPDRVKIEVDEPVEVASLPWVDGGLPASGPGGGSPGILGQILRTDSAPAPAPHVEPKAASVAKRAVTEVRQVRVGGNVKMAQILRRVEPQYPALAKAARVQGTVELVGVIATDGHLKELRLVSGHPLLAHAAMEAVSQWIYTPTLLNNEPVEVIAPITVTFHLN